MAEPAQDLRTECLTINMGPQHPSTHGVLRVILELEGEVVVKATPVIGHLHRASRNSQNRRPITRPSP